MPSTRKKESNLLICSASPRDIPEVMRERAKLTQDRFYMKYFKPREAYTRIRDFFLDNTQYTHLVIAPDDLVVYPSHVKQLEEDLKSFDYPVISGICNVDQRTKKNYAAIARNLPKRRYIDEGIRDPYDWYTFDEIKNLGNPFLQVEFSGTPLMAIRRDIVKLIPFEDDGDYNEDGGEGQAQDLHFNHNCKKHNIPVIVDTRINMLHMRHAGEILVGKVPPMIIYVCSKSNLY